LRYLLAGTPAKELQPGDRLRGDDGRLWPVESVTATDEWLPVYNARIADYHTYYVCAPGGNVWLWAHNTYSIPSSLEGATKRTLDLTNSAWRSTRFIKKGIVYVLKDKNTGECLKVGQTTAKKFVGRFEKYVSAGNRHKRDLVVDVFEVPLSKRGAFEGQLRRLFGDFPALPWDNTGLRLGRPGPGIPK
jgi:hypothetical protein